MIKKTISKLWAIGFKRKLSVGFLAVILIMSAGMLFSISKVSRVAQHGIDVMEHQHPISINALRLVQDLYEMHSLLNAFLISSNKATFSKYKQKYDALIEDIRTLKDAVDSSENTGSVDKAFIYADLEKALTAIKEYRRYGTKILSLHENYAENQPGVTRAMGFLSPINEEFLATIAELESEIEIQSEDEEGVLWKDIQISLKNVKYRWIQMTNNIRAVMATRVKVITWTNLDTFVYGITAELRRLDNYKIHLNESSYEHLLDIQKRYMHELPNVKKLIEKKSWRVDLELMNNEIQPLVKNIADVLNHIANTQVNKSMDESRSHSQALGGMYAENIVIFILGLLIAFIVMLSIIRSLTRPLNEITNAANKVAEGDLSVRTNPNTNDEFGKLGTQFNSMIENLGELIHEQTDSQDRLRVQQNALMQLSKLDSLIQGNFKESSRETIRIAAETLHIDCVSFWLENDNQDITSIFRYSLLSDSYDNESPNRLSKESELYKNLDHARILCISDIRENKGIRDFYHDELKIENIKSVLASSIIEEGKIIGVICFERSEKTKKWHTDEQHFAAAVSDLIALGLIQRRRRLADERLGNMAHQLEVKNIDLEHALVEANSAAKVKSEFLGNMSHELRTPMNGIMGMLSILRDMNSSIEQQEYMEAAYHSSERLLTLLNNLLDYTKIEAGKISLEQIEFDVVSSVQNVIELMQPSAEKKEIELKYTADNNLPKKIISDPTRLHQVLNNLVSNAIKFTSEGCVTINVSLLSCDIDTCNIKISVSDTGIGMPEESIENIFDAFTQADGSTTRKFGGTGLGLSITKSIVELMGGEIEVESTEGEGSTFSLRLTVNRSISETSKKQESVSNKNIQYLSEIEANKQAELSELMGEGSHSFIEKVLEESTHLLSDVQVAFDRNDKDTSLRIINNLKHGVYTIGLTHLSEYCNTIIDNIEGDDMKMARLYVGQIKVVLNRLSEQAVA